MMKNTELVERVIDIATNYKTVYMWGVFGSPVSEDIIRKKTAQYGSWYNATRVAFFRSLIGRGYFAFDCVNLVKAILWGWTGDKNATYGGARYATNGVPDASANGFFQRCQNITDRFGNLKPGAALWMPGHFGVYIGDGKAVECTPIWKNGVQITAVGNIGKIAGLNTRTWAKTGTIPYIEYEEEDEMATVIEKLKTQTGKSEAEIIDALAFLVKNANTKEDAWEKAGSQALNDAGLASSQHPGNEPVEFGELGTIMTNLEAKMDKKYKR